MEGELANITMEQGSRGARACRWPKKWREEGRPVLIGEESGWRSRRWHKRRRAAVEGGSGAAACGDGTLQRHVTGEQGLRVGLLACHSTIVFYWKFSKQIWIWNGQNMAFCCKKNQIKYEIVGNWIRRNFLHWNFSNFGMEFELKFGEPLRAKFDWIWMPWAWKLLNLLEFDM
jgi:hypothetical protein